MMLQKVNHVLKEAVFCFSVRAVADFLLIALCVWEEGLCDLVSRATVLHNSLPLLEVGGQMYLYRVLCCAEKWGQSGVRKSGCRISCLSGVLA